jgi:Malectin domain/Thrombospondin type 3 repeat
VPGGALPRLLLGVLALITAIAVAVVPVVEARPKERNTKQDDVAAETVPAGDSGQSDVLYGDGATAAAEQPLTVGSNSGSSDERTLLELDADGDYIPDALDNCPSVQNPDQADSDGDGNGDPCTVYQDTDGDTVPDKSDNCPNIATSDFSDRDGDGVGDSCDKSPDGIEPEPEPVPKLDGEGDTGETEPPAPENGENQDGSEIERPGRSRSRVRDRTETSEPIITTGLDSENEGVGGPPAQDEPPTEEPARDNPRRNEELIAEAAASGELDAPPEPPPAPQRAWDEEAAADVTEWDSFVKIDAGAAADADSTAGRLGDDEPNDAGSRNDPQVSDGGDSLDRSESDVSDSSYARGWVRAKLLLQEDLPDDEPTEGDNASDGNEQDAPAGDGGGRNGSAPVPVENGLVISGTEKEEDPPRATDRDSESGDTVDEPETGDEPELLDEPPASQNAGQEDENNDRDTGDSGEPSSRKDGSRRDGSSRGAAAAAPERQQESAGADRARQAVSDEKKRRPRRGETGAAPTGWNSDRYFAGGSALNWSGDLEVVGTDDPGLYLTQRSGSGPGKRRGFAYAIPVDESGVYMVRLYFAEPYWGAPGGPEGDVGRRVFSVTAEGEMLLEDLDVFAEVGQLTALVKQAEVEVQDGELNLSFAASEGEPIIAAIEVLQPAG